MPKKSWSEQDETELRKLASQGLSATAIGVKLTKTRGSIVGWCSRNGVTLTGRIKSTLPGPEPQSLPKSRTGSFGRTRANDLKAVAESPTGVLRQPEAHEIKQPTWPRAENENSVGFMTTREEHCRMPLWGFRERTGMVCGNNAVVGPYCRACAAVVYQPRATIIRR